MLLSMLEGPPQSNRTPTIADRAIFGILKSCRNRGSLFLQSTGLWLNCGKSTTLLQFRPIGFDSVEIAPNRRRCEAIRQNCKPNLPNWDRLRTAIPSITVGLYETFNPSTILANWEGNRGLVQFCHNHGPRPHEVTNPIQRHVS